MSDTPGAEGIEGCELPNVGVVTELRSSARAVHFLNCRTTSAVSVFFFTFSPLETLYTNTLYKYMLCMERL